MKNIFIHRYAGILSAYGLALADVVHEAQEPANREFEISNQTFFFVIKYFFQIILIILNHDFIFWKINVEMNYILKDLINHKYHLNTIYI